MRSDMKKVVVKRSWNGWWKLTQKLGARLRYIPDHDYEEQPKRANISKSCKYRGREKGFIRIQGPLERMLRKHVGRPWNDVHSEMCARLDKRKATGKYIVEYLEATVEIHCYEGVDGAIYASWQDRPVDGLYVDPRTGLLCVTPDRRRRRRRRKQPRTTPVERLDLGDDTAYAKHEGIWYLVRYEWMWIDLDESPKSRRDLLLKSAVPLHRRWNYIPVQKKQCTRAEMVKVRAMLAREEKRKAAETRRKKRNRYVELQRNQGRTRRTYQSVDKGRPGRRGG